MTIATELWLVTLVGLVSTFLAILALRPLALKTRLVDVPSHRKRHQGSVPLTGGLAIFMGLFVGTLVLAIFFPETSTNKKLVYLLITGGLVLVMGLMDDYKDLGARLRFIVQCGICLIMIMTTGIYVKTLGNIAGIGEVNLGVLGIPFTMVAVVGFINALNMTDGIDGLAGGLALVALISMFVFQSATGNFAHFDKLMLLAVVIVPYMIANLGLLGMNKIFLGDAGSMLVGYMIAWAFIILAHPSEGSIEPVDALWCVAIPLFDMWAVMFKRVRHGLSPFNPDRGHLHHLFIGFGVSDRLSLAGIILLSLALVFIGAVIARYLPGYSFHLFMALLAVYIVVTNRFEKRLPDEAEPELAGALGAEQTETV